jgi:hypothetical protein
MVVAAACTTSPRIKHAQSTQEGGRDNKPQDRA